MLPSNSLCSVLPHCLRLLARVDFDNHHAVIQNNVGTRFDLNVFVVCANIKCTLWV